LVPLPDFSHSRPFVNGRQQRTAELASRDRSAGCWCLTSSQSRCRIRKGESSFPLSSVEPRPHPVYSLLFALTLIAHSLFLNFFAITETPFAYPRDTSTSRAQILIDRYLEPMFKNLIARLACHNTTTGRQDGRQQSPSRKDHRPCIGRERRVPRQKVGKTCYPR